MLLRAQTLVSEENDRVKEIRQVKQAWKAISCPNWILTTLNTESGTIEFGEFRYKNIVQSVKCIPF